MTKTMRRALFGGLALACVTSISAAFAETETYQPGVWVDPDGCAHWAMDDGYEGYMSPVRNRDGSPVCNRQEVCGIVPTDYLFATDSARISASGKARLQEFFRKTSAFGYLIYGHTDSRASDEYNMRLSSNRASAVAGVAQSIGARIVDVKGFGERRPRASNGSSAGMAQNRRVEIVCLR